MTATASIRLRFRGEHIVLDIEGTTSPLAFVQTVLFPYVRQHLADYVHRLWGTPDLERLRIALAEAVPLGGGRPLSDPQTFIAEMHRLMDRDAKVGPLKELQGWIWKDGFEMGRLQAVVYDDVPPAVQAWTRAGIRVSIYSSGSVLAQQFFFRHLTGPVHDLTPWLHRYFDTMIGPKREVRSYLQMVTALRTEPAATLFLSDLPAELDAARQAGLATGLVVRPDSPPSNAARGTEATIGHPFVRHFAEIDAQFAGAPPASR